jgi:23S rRNA G2445 N2-methylase RlmL
MLDTSGDGLHKRGYRRNATEAPIKETLAATIADVGRVRRDSVVMDPFCGSGTLVIEAAQKALNIAPGLRRRFAAEHYAFVPAAVWSGAAPARRWRMRGWTPRSKGIGYDIDPAAGGARQRPTPGWRASAGAAGSRWADVAAFDGAPRGAGADQPALRRAAWAALR